jgi:hypothetical protein
MTRWLKLFEQRFRIDETASLAASLESTDRMLEQVARFLRGQNDRASILN